MNPETLKPVVKLAGLDGNSFVIIGRCLAVARRAKWPEEKINQVRTEFQSGDYDNVLQTALKYFEVE